MRSAEILGAERVEFLGYTDSGMMGEPTNDDPGCFWQADVEVAAARLAGLLRDEAVDVLTIYDDHGLYGHPDHIQVHRVGRRAAELLGLPSTRVFCSTMNRDLMRERLAPGGRRGRGRTCRRWRRCRGAEPTTSRRRSSTSRRSACPPTRSPTPSTCAAVLDRKRRSMLAHRSQIADDAFYLRSPEVFEAAFGTEWFASLGRRRPPGRAVRGCTAGGRTVSSALPEVSP